MAVQAQLYSENFGFPLGGDDGGGGGDDGGGGGNSSPDWMENACGFNELYLFNLQQQQRRQQWKQQYQQNQDLCFQNGFSITKNTRPVSMHLQHVAAHIQKQNQEIEGFIGLQNERLRVALQAHRRQQLVTILNKYESRSQILLKQKDDEIMKAVNQTMELEDVLRKTDVERQTWQRAAKENEALVISLSNTIERLEESRYLSMKDEANDAESCCQTGEANDEEQEHTNTICKRCFAADSCVVVLPCRHLCSCKACDAFLDACPLCRMVKKASIEVFL